MDFPFKTKVELIQVTSIHRGGTCIIFSKECIQAHLGAKAKARDMGTKATNQLHQLKNLNAIYL